MKKLLSVLSSTLQGGLRGGLLILALLATTTLWAQRFQVGDLYYNVTSDTVPYTVEVTYQYEGSNLNYSGLTTVEFPASVIYDGITYDVTSIGENAFNNHSTLISVTIGNNVTSIGKSAFSSIYSLDSVIIGNSVTSIGDYAFYQCKALSSVTIGNSVATIGDYAFQLCYSLTSVTIPNSVKSIGHDAFSWCHKLSSISIGDSVMSIGYSAFERTEVYENKAYWEDGKVLYIDNYLIRANGISGDYTIKDSTRVIADRAFSSCSSLTSITIPESVTSIGEYAFNGCSALTSITIPNSVTSIRNYTFRNCSALTSITIPNSVTSIGESAFENCSALTSITIPENVTSIEEYAFYNCSSLKSVVWNATNCTDFRFGQSTVTSITFGNSVTHIPELLCHSMLNLTSVTIPNSVTSIGYGAFYGCSSLTSVTIPESVTSIGRDAFEDCSSLTSVTIPESVTSIGGEAFKNCSSLTSVTIPESVTSIGGEAFKNCSSLTSVVWKAKNCTSESPFSGGTSQITSFTFGDSVESIPRYLCSGMANLTSITIPNSVTSIGYYAFNSCYSLTSVVWNVVEIKDFKRDEAPFSSSPITVFTFGDDVKSIPAYLCSEIESLQSIVIPDNVDSVKSYAFNGCSSLKSVRIGEGLKYIDQDAFSKCTALESIEWNAINCNVYSQYTNHLPFSSCEQITSFTFGDSVESLPNYLCYGMNNLPSIIIPNSVTSIGDYAFYSCDSLTSVTIPNSVTSIGDYAFSKCSALSSAIIGNSVTNIGSYAFQHCSSLASVTIGNSVTSIGDNAFYGCSSLISATIGNSVTSIGAEAFRYCNSLTSINLPNSVTSIGESAFKDCSALSSAIIGNSVTNIGSSAFYGCSSLTSITIPESVTSIGEYAFNGCSNLANLTIKAKSAEDYIQRKINYQLYKYNSGLQALTRSLLINGKEATKIVIPENIDSIGDYTFYNCSHIQSITLHDDIYLDKTSFLGCDSIASITITTPSIEAYCQSSLNNNLYKYGLKTATRNILVDNEDITLLIIPESISSISEYLFYNCSTITSLIIPENIESIGYGAFYGCEKLEAIYQTSATPPTIGSITFTSLPVCYIPYGSLTAYENSTWKKQVSRFVEEPITGYQIYYTSSDGNVVTPSAADAFNATVFSNVYENGQGIITFDGPIHTIKTGAFENCSTLTSITIPVSIKRIEDRAFANCSALGVVEVKCITPPTLGEEAFTSAPTCYIPCGTKHFYDVSTWAEQANDFIVEDCGGKQIFYTTVDGGIITPSTADIGANLISNVYEFGQGVMTFDGPVTKMAGFSNCSTLTSITIPESVTTVESSCFGSCSLLTSIVWNAKHVEQVRWGGGSWLGASLPIYDLFGGVRSQITSFVFGDNVEYIPDHLCYYMENLTSVVIPESVQNIGTYAFSRCSALTSAVIGNNVKTIGEHAFSYCSSLTSATIGKSVITIGEEAFRDCSALTSIVIPDSVLAIENSTFFNCSALTSVTLNNSLISIYDYAFMDCSSLTSITIPEDVTYIGDRVFYDCSALTSITWNARHCNDFLSYDSYSDVYKPEQKFEGCSITSFIISENVEKLPASLCYKMSDLQSITIPEKVNMIGDYTFDGCTSLTSITIPENVYSIGASAFNGCSSLTSITLPENLYSMGERAFNGCSSLTSITIPENVSSIGGYAFSYCSSLKTVAWNAINTGDILNSNSYTCTPFSSSPIETLVIGDKVTYIPERFCEECSTLASVTIGKNVREIGYYAFYNCTSLTQTNYTGNIASWCQIAFGGFSSNPTYYSKNLFINGEEVKDVVIPNTVTSISSCAFYNCEKISSLTIPESVTSIGYNAFAGCKKLFDIYCYPTTPPEAQENSFTNYNVNLYVPCESLKDYQMDMVFGSFKYIQCLEDTPPSEPQDTTIYHPTVYDVICEGETYIWMGMQFTEAGRYEVVEIVEEEDYIYHNIYTLELTVQPSETVVLVEEAYDSYEWHGVVYTESGSYFYEEWCYQEILELTIIPSTETAVDNMQTDSDHSAQKILRDQQILILRDGKTYTIMGAEVK